MVGVQLLMGGLRFCMPPRLRSSWKMMHGLWGWATVGAGGCATAVFADPTGLRARVGDHGTCRSTGQMQQMAGRGTVSRAFVTHWPSLSNTGAIMVGDSWAPRQVRSPVSPHSPILPSVESRHAAGAANCVIGTFLMRDLLGMPWLTWLLPVVCPLGALMLGGMLLEVPRMRRVKEVRGEGGDRPAQIASEGRWLESDRSALEGCCGTRLTVGSSCDWLQALQAAQNCRHGSRWT